MSEIDNWEKSLIIAKRFRKLKWTSGPSVVMKDPWEEGSLSYNKKLRRLEKSLRLYIVFSSELRRALFNVFHSIPLYAWTYSETIVGHGYGKTVIKYQQQ
jgi:hypothetical protein